MREQLEVYDITTLDEAKILTNELRMKIFTLYFDQKPRTAKQLADEIGLAPSKVHYHVRELVKAGLLFLCDTKEVNGIIEKYYLPIAKDIRILIHQLDEKGKLDVVNKTLTDVKKQIMYSFEHSKEEDLLVTMNLRLFPSEKAEFVSELKEIFQKWESRIKSRDPKGEDLYGLIISLFSKKG